MPHFLQLRTRAGFIPGDELAQDEFAKIKVGATILTDYRKVKNPQQRKLMYGTLRRMFENQRHPVRYPVWEGFYVAIKIALGWFDEMPSKKGLVPVLWSVADMDDAKFVPCLEQVLALAERLSIPTEDLRVEANA